MEAIGHQLMAMRIDDQMVDILQTQLVQITDKFSSGWGQSMGTDCRFVAEALYYGMSFVQRSAAKRNATPGMSAVDLGIDGGATGLVDNANALLVMSYLVLKWSLVKLQNIATLEGNAANLKPCNAAYLVVYARLSCCLTIYRLVRL